MPTAQPARGRLAIRALVRLGAGVIIMFAVVFGSAGTTDYWQAWVVMAVLLVPVVLAFAWLLAWHPELLERRLRAREKRPRESLLIKLGSLTHLCAFLLPGFDRRFGWSHVPAELVVAADVLFLLGYVLFLFVLRANAYASRIIEVEQGQSVVTTGPYAVVRHPMYAAHLVMFLPVPLALGSWWALIPMLTLPAVLVARILDEERLLVAELPGYPEYTRSVRYRLLPGVW